ncbi:hypothetical protein D043_2605A, partial [Vibrio parahaemolyticus EKP-021]
MQPISQRWLLL